MGPLTKKNSDIDLRLARTGCAQASFDARAQAKSATKLIDGLRVMADSPAVHRDVRQSLNEILVKLDPMVPVLGEVQNELERIAKGL